MKSLMVGIALSAMAITAAFADLNDRPGGRGGSDQHNSTTQGDTRGNVDQRDWKQGQIRREPRHKICYWHHNHRHCHWGW